MTADETQKTLPETRASAEGSTDSSGNDAPASTDVSPATSSDSGAAAEAATASSEPSEKEPAQASDAAHATAADAAAASQEAGAAEGVAASSAAERPAGETNEGSAQEGVQAAQVEAPGAPTEAGEAGGSDAAEGAAEGSALFEAAAATSGEAAPGEAAPGEVTEGAAAEGDAAKKKKKRRKKKKKPAGEGGRSHERAPFHAGEEVFGKVTAVLDTAIMIDLSGKALAIFDRSEMAADDLVPEVGDRFVGQVLADGARGGLVVMTRKLLREEEAKPKIEQAAKDGTLVRGLVTGVIKGGVEVLIEGLRAFAPASGVDLHPRTANFINLVGQVLDFKVVTYEKQGREVVVSRRPMLEKEAHERRKQARELLKEGMEMQGVVRTVVEWGAFVALPEAENLEGLVHISELSHDPREKMADVLKPGQKVQVKIQKIDEKGKIWLSRKALIEDPFQVLLGGIKQGDVVEGEVTRVEDFGAFIKLADGFEGLCHAADLGVERVNDARTVLKPGEQVKMIVHHIDPKQRRVALHPVPPESQAGEEKQRVVKGGKVKVEVVKADKPGLFVRILGATGRQARGFIPAGQTGTPRGAELRKHFETGAQLEAQVLEIDPKRSEAKLSIVRLHQDEERKAHKEYRAKLKAESNFGTLGDLLKQKLGG